MVQSSSSLSALLLIFLIAIFQINSISGNVWDYSKQKGRPLIIAHRGFSSQFPENTLQAFDAALYAGADFIQLDVQITKDGVLVVSHDPYLTRVTNVAMKPEFASLKRTFKYQNQDKEDWWVFDFTLAQLKTLGIKQALVPNRPSMLDFQVTFPTLEEVLQWAINFNHVQQGSRNPEGRLGGVLIEAKDCDVYRAIRGVQQGLMIVNLLEKYGLKDMASAGLKAPIMLHSFDAETVQLWHTAVPSLPNSMLASSLTDLSQGLGDIAKFAQITGLNINGYFNNKWHIHTKLVKQIHKVGMMAHCWTYRDDTLNWSVKHMYQQYQKSMFMGLDGIITEFPEAAVNVIQILKNSLKGKLYWGFHESKIQKSPISQQIKMEIGNQGEEENSSQ